MFFMFTHVHAYLLMKPNMITLHVYARFCMFLHDCTLFKYTHHDGCALFTHVSVVFTHQSRSRTAITEELAAGEERGSW
jgi:hypothetical protein